MSKRDEFITFVNALKATSPTISTEQYRGLHRQAETKYDLSVEEASEILKGSGLNVERTDNYIIVKSTNKFTFSEIYVSLYDYGIFNRFTQTRA